MPDPTVERIPHPDNPKAYRVRALIDFDLQDPLKQVLDTTPADLSDIPVQAVKTLFTRDLIVHIYAHDGEGQQVAQLLAARPDIEVVITSHALMHTEKGVTSFTLNALTDQQVQFLRERITPPNNPAHQPDPDHEDPTP